jgi:hypothetical protein
MKPTALQPRPFTALFAAIAVIAALLVALNSDAGASSKASFPTGLLVPPAGTTLLGAAITKGSPTSEPAAWSRMEAGAGNNLDIAQVMYSWGQAIPSWRESYHLQHGRTPMIGWGFVKTTDVLSGKYDNYILKTANGIKALGQPVFLRWFWEMDSNALKSYAVNPTDYRLAWAHIRLLFTLAGATNVAWVWAPTSHGYDVGRVDQWYPGSNQVDWVAADGFDWYPAKHGAKNESFAQIFKSFYAWGVAQNKPLMVSATGALETKDPMAKATWITNMAATVATAYPGIRAISYLDTTSGDYNDPTLVVHWELGTSQNALTAWNTIARHAVFAKAR